MKIETTFSCGDKAWVFTSQRVQQLTIGQVRVEITDSPGVAQEGIAFDNYAACKSYREQYMCIETGIGSGVVYTLGKSVFVTQAECEAASAKNIKQAEDERRAIEIRNREHLLSQEDSLRKQLARIESIKEEIA